MMNRWGMIRRNRRGFTMIELTIAGSISTALGIGMASLTMMAQRIVKGDFSQQIAIKNAKSAVDGLYGINREFSMAVASGAAAPQVFDSAGKATTTGWGNRV